MSTIQGKNQKNQFDIEFLITVIRKHWLLLGLCTIIGLSVAFIYNKLKTPVYDVSSSLLISGESDNLSQIPTQIFEDMGFTSNNNNFQNELLLLRSTVLIGEALNNLNLQISYFHKKIFKTIELYKSSPFIVVFNQNHPQPVDIKIKIKILDENTFRISASEDDVNIFLYNTNTVFQKLPKFELDQTGSFGSNITSDYYDFKVILNENYSFEDYSPNKFLFIFHNPRNLAKAYKTALKVEPNDLESTVAILSMETTAPNKTIDFINSLTGVYLAKSLDKKVHMSVKTVEYIDSQLDAIQDSLRNAEESLQRFRTSNQVMDIGAKTGRIYDQLQELDREKASLSVQYKYYEYINDYFEKNKVYSDLIAPSAMGIEDPLLNNMIQELLQLNAERMSLMENNQEKSPYLKKLNIQIDNLKNTISENIKYIINTTEIALQDVNSRMRQLNNEINKLPKTERELFGYERKFNLNDAIYTYMLEKRAEAEIAKVSFLPDAEIMEPTDLTSNGAISPKKKLNYILGLLLGLFFPMSIIRIRDILNIKLVDASELERLTTIPILGKIYNNNKKLELVVNNFPKSHIAESFRMLRTNLHYFLPTDKNSIIVLTSSFAQEGKSFLSNNLAVSLATANHKTVLLSFDLRKPKIFERLNIKNEVGISSFLSEQTTFDQIVQKSNIENLNVITSGPIPPNPSELIASSKTNDLFSFLSGTYKYIIVDTPPVGLISDSYLLMDKADLNIYVVRQNHTIKKEMVSILNELKEKKIHNLCLLLNDIPLYGSSKYGYGYYEEEKTRKLFSRK